MSSQRSIWWWLGVFLVMLGINKQLDLQSLLTQIARDMAKGEGWYDIRETVQQVFIAVMIIAGISGSVVLHWAMRRRDNEVRVALTGFALLLAFIAVRASSFHHVDLFLGSTLFGARFNWILEIGGIGVITAAAVRAGMRRDA